MVCKCDINGCGLRWRGPYPAIDTRTGPALRASAGSCWLTFSAYSTDSEIMLSLTMSGAESSPSATVARAMARVDEVTILMSGSRCLCCHWGLSMVTGVTVCVHWLTENTTLTQTLVFTVREREWQPGTQWLVTRGQAGSASTSHSGLQMALPAKRGY